MKKRKIKYTDEPIRKIKIVDDFLPDSQDLVLKEEKTNILEQSGLIGCLTGSGITSTNYKKNLCKE